MSRVGLTGTNREKRAAKGTLGTQMNYGQLSRRQGTSKGMTLAGDPKIHKVLFHCIFGVATYTPRPILKNFTPLDKFTYIDRMEPRQGDSS
jgi:hypothetical protein